MPAAFDSSLPIVLIVLAGVVALVSIAVMIRAMRRHGRLTLVRSVVSGVLTLGVLAVAAAGVVAVAPVGTHVVPASSVSSSDDSIGDLQLPTLALDD